MILSSVFLVLSTENKQQNFSKHYTVLHFSIMNKSWCDSKHTCTEVLRVYFLTTRSILHTAQSDRTRQESGPCQYQPFYVGKVRQTHTFYHKPFTLTQAFFNAYFHLFIVVRLTCNTCAVLQTVLTLHRNRFTESKDI